MSGGKAWVGGMGQRVARVVSGAREPMSGGHLPWPDPPCLKGRMQHHLCFPWWCHRNLAAGNIWAACNTLAGSSTCLLPGQQHNYPFFFFWCLGLINLRWPFVCMWWSLSASWENCARFRYPVGILKTCIPFCSSFFCVESCLSSMTSYWMPPSFGNNSVLPGSPTLQVTQSSWTPPRENCVELWKCNLTFDFGIKTHFPLWGAVLLWKQIILARYHIRYLCHTQKSTRKHEVQG